MGYVASSGLYEDALALSEKVGDWTTKTFGSDAKKTIYDEVGGLVTAGMSAIGLSDGSAVTPQGVIVTAKPVNLRALMVKKTAPAPAPGVAGAVSGTVAKVTTAINTAVGSPYGVYMVAGGVGLLAYLLLRKKR
jgi:hypothetical protein